LAENIDGEQYRKIPSKALNRITGYQPKFLVLVLGLDTAKGDPTGSFQLVVKDFLVNERMIGELKLPTLIVQEGGYKTRTLGTNARQFFTDLWGGMSV
tara:strand:- start:4475 stop:4768 length:294 start_codon:yes stop_codon:yes gene_type:complete